VLGWFAVVGLIYLLICAVGIISRGFRGLGGDAAHAMFAFAGNSWVGLCVGVLATVLIQSSTTTTAIAVSAVGSGALPIRGAVPIILGANIGTTVTCTLVALTFVGNRDEFRRALGASTIHDFYNLLSLLIFFPIELGVASAGTDKRSHGQRALRRRMAARPEPVQRRQRRH